jgi:acetyl/propionyl-CoA carboxylase alpha subunit
MASTTIDVQLDGETLAVTVEPLTSSGSRYRVSWNGQTRVVDARSLGSDALSLVFVEGGAGSYRVRCEEADRPGGLDVHVEGVLVPLSIDDGRARLVGRGGRASTGPGGWQVTAPMPGKVVRVLVKPGDDVEARQGVIVVEAMKMENELTAPQAGRVAEIRVDEGASVEAGRVLVVIESSE